MNVRTGGDPCLLLDKVKLFDIISLRKTSTKTCLAIPDFQREEYLVKFPY